MSLVFLPWRRVVNSTVGSNPLLFQCCNVHVTSIMRPKEKKTSLYSARVTIILPNFENGSR